jgi:hypothetical protein
MSVINRRRSGSWGPIGEFIARYDAEWLIERLGHRTPSAARAAALAA